MAEGGQTSGNRTVYVISLLLAFISLGLQIAGLVTIGWLIMDFGYLNIDMDISMGLWQIKVCTTGVCLTESIDKFWNGQGITSPVTHEMWEYRVETILGVLFIMTAIFCLFKLSCCSKDGVYNNCKGYWVVSCTCSALSAIMSLIAAGKYGRAVGDAHTLLNQSGESPIKLPFSIVITGVGGLIAGLVFLIVVIETCRAMNAINRSQGQMIQMSPYPTTGQPYGAPPYTAQQYGTPPNTGHPYGAPPNTANPHGAHQYGGQQAYPSDQFGYTSQPQSYGTKNPGFDSRSQFGPEYNPSSNDSTRYGSSSKYAPSDSHDGRSGFSGRRY